MKRPCSEPSKYCQFQMALAGYDIYSRASGKKLYKLDVFNNFNKFGRELEMELIVSRMYPYFEFKENENFKYRDAKTT